MLNDFTWNMTGYIPKHAVNPYGDGIIPYVAERIFQLETDPPPVAIQNEHFLPVLERKLFSFYFFLPLPPTTPQNHTQLFFFFFGMAAICMTQTVL